MPTNNPMTTELGEAVARLRREIKDARESGVLTNMTFASVEDLELILAELDRMAWRPIESAPKDGSPMLVFSTGKHIGRATWNSEELMFEDEHHEFIDQRWLTHWIPLPSPPKEQP